MSETITCHGRCPLRSGRIESPTPPPDGPDGPPIQGLIPFRAPLRELVEQKICDLCWQEWLKVQIKVINELALNLGDPRSHEIIEAHARDFFGLSDAPETDTDFARLGERPPAQNGD